MASDLPSEFDVVVLGTGLPESILAAAFSRNGYTVLHLDRNTYYSGHWASFSLKSVEQWTSNIENADVLAQKGTPELKDGERAIAIPDLDKDFSNVEMKYHIDDDEEVKTDTTQKSAPLAGADEEPKAGPVDEEPKAGPVDEEPKAGPADEEPKAGPVDEEPKAGPVDEEPKAGPVDEEPKAGPVDEEPKAGHVDEEPKAGPVDEEPKAGPVSIIESTADGCEGQFEDKKEDETDDPEKHPDDKSSNSISDSHHPGLTKANDAASTSKVWQKSDLFSKWRQFNLDLFPKVLYCSGKMVELLIVSDVAKYQEFRTVSRMLTLLNGQIETVPCSRADVFSSKKVSMLEKRLLMKFLTFCGEYEKHPEQYQDHVGRPFSEFLASKKLTPNTHHFIFHTIAMATGEMTTEEGLKKTQRFLHSLGRYGNTAFLSPLYGSGELPQGFCRLCAVFGGVYCLNMSVSNVVVDENNKACAVLTTEGQRIECKHLIVGPSYIAEEFQMSTSLPTNAASTSRAVLITNKSVLPVDGQELSMFHLLPEDDPNRPVVILELPPSSMVCPADTYVVHITQRKGSGNPEADLEPVVRSLFGGSSQADSKPFVMWSLFFSHADKSSISPSSSLPSNVHLLPGPGAEVDMDDIVVLTRTVWDKICPEEDFLPKPPRPEDIISVDDQPTMFGEQSENAFEDAEEDKSKGDNSQTEDKNVEAGIENNDTQTESESHGNTTNEASQHEKGNGVVDNSDKNPPHCKHVDQNTEHIEG